MAFSADADLIKRRPNILENGTDSFADQHDEAERIILRDLAVWYLREAAERGISPRTTPMDKTLFLNADTEIKPAATLLAMSLAYDFLTKDKPADQDGFAAQRDHFRQAFEQEWEAAKRAGFSYDWDSSAAIEDTEKPPQIGRRNLARG